MSIDWFETVRQIVDPRVPVFNGVVERAVEQESIEHLDFEPPCGGPNHDKGLYGHNPNESASWLVSAPCGEQMDACNSWVQDCMSNLLRYVDCSCDRKRHWLHTLQFIPFSADR